MVFSGGGEVGCPLVFCIPLEVKQEYKEWIGKVDIPELYEKKGCRIKDTAERGSRRGWKGLRLRTKQFGAMHKTALHHFLELF